MATKTSIIISLVFISFFTMNFRCVKEGVPKPFDNNFEIPVDIYPLKKVYTLTDTIWIETDVPGKFLFDLKTNRNILVDSGKITFSATFNEFGTYITNAPNGLADVISL